MYGAYLTNISMLSYRHLPRLTTRVRRGYLTTKRILSIGDNKTSKGLLE